MTGLEKNTRINASLQDRLTRVGAIVIGTVMLLTWLFLHANSVSGQAHINYTQLLRDLREADVQVNSEVLASRMGLTRNYDALATYINKMMLDGNLITDAPDFLSAPDQALLEEQAGKVKATLKKKVRLIDLFKRNNAILLNSLNWFQRSADTFLAVNTEPNIAKRLEHYVRDTLFYIQAPEHERSMELQTTHQQLVELSLLEINNIDPQARQTINNLLQHGSIIKKYLLKADNQLRELLSLPTSLQQEKLALIYSKGHTHAQELAEQFRNLIYIVAILLTAYLAYTFIHLDKTRRSLARAHREVSERYLAQQNAEALLRLHDTAFNSAHEGISLTDARGNIIAVNPAFTRITGYDQKEVIGRNPRVLRSGRHDADFYRDMWKSIHNTGNWRGEIWNRNKFGEVYPELLSITTVRNTEGLVTNYVAVFSDISRIKAQEKQLRKMAYYDDLTKLPNRVLLTDRMTQAISQSQRTGKFMAVCYLDLDGFKPVNDTYGHEAGDSLLMEMAQRFQNILRGGDTVARLGGDEFVFLLVGLEKIEEYEYAVQRLMQTVTQAILISGEPVTLTASIGVTLYPSDSSDADSLLRHADQAMYQAKQQGKECYHLFDPKQDSLARSQFERITRIESALINNELVLYYQPKVDLREGKVIGMEALIRWQHPHRGLVLPVDFLPSIEEHELIVQIGQWVIDTALTQLEQWKTAGLDFQLSINVANRQLQQPDFVEDLKNTLARHPVIDASSLELEVLETTALEDMVNVSRIIEECKAFGVSFALDDFGTGYSSLTYLKRLPASTLKIDQSFIRDMLHDPGNLAIVNSILGLSSAFQRRAIAEGAETHEHCRLLLQLGCRYVQGFGVSKPMPANEVQAWFNVWQPDPVWEPYRSLYWDDIHYPLLAAEVEHQSWINHLIYSVNEGLPVLQPKVGEAHSCRFGQWYYGPEQQRYKDILCFQQIATAHKCVHEIARKIEHYCQTGEYNVARKLLPELLAQRDEIIRQLNRLSLAVAQKIE